MLRVSSRQKIDDLRLILVRISSASSRNSLTAITSPLLVIYYSPGRPFRLLTGEFQYGPIRKDVLVFGASFSGHS